MSKKKNAKRKAQLSEKAKYESLCFQVKFGRSKRMPDLPDDNPIVNAELDAIRQTGLTEGILLLRDIVEGVRQELQREQEPDTNSLQGAFVPYLLGITLSHPQETEGQTNPLANLTDESIPLQVQLRYDNEVRNRVVEWIKEHFEGITVTTRLGQPIVKLPRIIVEIRRTIHPHQA